MKDEIKEIIITFPGQILDYVDTKEHLLELFNYITNLQEKNNNLQEDFKRHIDRINELTERSDNLQEELKSANESITWWQNRFKAIQEENERLKEYKLKEKSNDHE